MASRDRTVAQRVALRGVLVAAAMVLSWVEAQIPAFFAVPGMKLGLTNLVVVTALYYLSWQDALVLNLVRIMLVGFTFGNLFSMAYSMAGGLLSFAVMLALKKSKAFGFVGVSVGGAVAHNTAQITAASLMLGSGYAFYYLPVLLTAAAVTGTVNGLLLKAALPAAERIVKSNAK